MNNFGSRPTPGQTGGVIRPTNPQGGMPPNNGYPASMYQAPQQGNMGYPGTAPQQQMDGIAIIRNALNGAGNGQMGGFDWNAVDSSSFLTENQRAALNGIGTQEDNLDNLRKQEAMLIAGRMMVNFANDCRFNNTNGQYRFFEYGRMNFLKHDDPNAMDDPIRSQFYQWVVKHPKLKQTIAIHASVLAGYQIAQRIIYGADFSVKDLEAWFSQSVNNILFLEMMNWFAKTQEGQQCYMRIGHGERYAITQLPQYKAAVAQTFMFMNIDNPYGELDPTPNVSYAKASSPTNYQVEAVAGQSTFGNTTPNPGVDDYFLNLDHYLQQSKAHYQHQHQHHQPPVHEPSTVPTFGYEARVTLRDDYKNITVENAKEFNLDIFNPIGNTGWYLVNDSIWGYVSNVLTKRFDRSHNAVNWPGVYTVVRFENFETLNGWESKSVSLTGPTMETVFADPLLLLPELREKENQEIEISSLTSSSFIKPGEEEDDYEPLVTKPLGKTPTVVNNDDVIVSMDSGEIETDLNVLFETLNPNTKEFFGVATAAVNYRKFLVESAEEVELVYKQAPFLVKDGGHQPKSFFSLTERLTNVFEYVITDRELQEEIKDHILEQLNRWLVECRGFGSKEGEPFYYRAKGDLFVAVSQLREFLATRDPDTLSALMNASQCVRLLDRCRLFASDVKRKEYLQSGKPNPLLAVKNALTLVIAREVVMAKVTNVETPLPSGNQTVLNVQRSNAPELFAMVGKAYSGASKHLSDGADMLISYDDTGSLWLFITNDFDSNVATLRKVPRVEQLVKYRF